MSPYLAMGANPACNVDPLGLQSMPFRDMIPNAGVVYIEGKLVVFGANFMGGGRSDAMQSLMNQMGSASAERAVDAWLTEALKGLGDSYLKQNADGTQTVFYTNVIAGEHMQKNASEFSEVSLGALSERGAEVNGYKFTIGSGGQQQNGGHDGIEIAQKVYDGLGVVEAVISGAFHEINKFTPSMKSWSRSFAGFSKKFEYGSYFLILADAVKKRELAPHHIVDAALTLSMRYVKNPYVVVGLGITMIVGDAISNHNTGKSMTEYIFDDKLFHGQTLKF